MPFDRRNIPLFAAFIPLYAATYWTSDVFRLPETGSTPWNPEAGLAVAALFCLGPRVLPVLAVIHFLCLAVWPPSPPCRGRQYWPPPTCRHLPPS